MCGGEVLGCTVCRMFRHVSLIAPNIVTEKSVAREQERGLGAYIGTHTHCKMKAVGFPRDKSATPFTL